jgi:hypothetical protein
MDRINPHEHAINREELLAHLVGKLLVIDRRLGMDAGRGKLLEDPVKAIVLWGSGSPGFGITAPEDCDLVGLRARISSVHTTLLAWRVRRAWTGV